MTTGPDNSVATIPIRRGFGSVLVIVILSIASVAIVGLATPGADRTIQNSYAVDSIRAGLEADAGVIMALAALTIGEDPAVPPPFRSDYDLRFEDADDQGVRTITVTAQHGRSTRVVMIELEFE